MSMYLNAWGCRGRWMQLSRATEEAMERHDTARHEVSPIEAYC